MWKYWRESLIILFENFTKIFSLTLPLPVWWQWWIFWYFGHALLPLFHHTFKVWFDLLLALEVPPGQSELVYWFSCFWFRETSKPNKLSPIRSEIFIIWIFLIFQCSKSKGESLGWQKTSIFSKNISNFQQNGIK